MLFLFDALYKIAINTIVSKLAFVVCLITLCFSAYFGWIETGTVESVNNMIVSSAVFGFSFILILAALSEVEKKSLGALDQVGTIQKYFQFLVFGQKVLIAEPANKSSYELFNE